MTPELSIIIAVYGQPLILEKQWEQLRKLPPLIQKRIEIVIVDDHGDPPAEIPADIQSGFHTQILHVDKDIPWNQMGARNLGAQECQASKLIFLDPDMVPDTLTWGKIYHLATKKLRRGTVWKFGLTGLRGKDEANFTSPNTWIFCVQDFLDIGGYDEDYAGAKGYSDVQLQHIVKEAYDVVVRRDILVRYHLNWSAADATVYTLDRSIARNGGIHKKAWGHVQRRYGSSWLKWWQDQRTTGKRGKTIRFPWTRTSTSKPSET